MLRHNLPVRGKLFASVAVHGLPPSIRETGNQTDYKKLHDIPYTRMKFVSMMKVLQVAQDFSNKKPFVAKKIDKRTNLYAAQ